MFFLTYLGRELRRRMRQSVVIALGLALGVGLVITVAAAAAGVKKAQADVLSSLYGVGTDMTVTEKPAVPKGGGNSIRVGFPAPGSKSGSTSSGGPEQCINNKCHALSGGTIDNLTSDSYGPFSQAKVTGVAKLHDVASAAGGLLLNDVQVTIPTQAHPNVGGPRTFSVDGVDPSHLGLGPLSNGKLKSGRGFTAADKTSDVAVVDSNYATSNKLKIGSTVTVASTKFKVIGIVSQPQGSGAPDIYIPLARAQALATSGPGSTAKLKNDVNTIYVAAASSSVISAVQNEISKLMPGSTVTTAQSLANTVTGSVSSTAKLANDLGKWLSILVLIAAFILASLMTVAAVSRRVREFGTLKALGWRGRRLVGQVMGESVTTGIIGGAIGIGLGFAGIAIINKIAPKLSAEVAESSGQHFFQSAGTAGPSGPVQSSSPLGGSTTHLVYVPLHASVGVAAVIAAVLLAIGGGLVAGSAGSWRIGRLRPAVALATVE